MTLEVHIWSDAELGELTRKVDEVVAVLTKGGAPVSRAEVENSMRKRMADMNGWILEPVEDVVKAATKRRTATSSSKLSTSRIVEAGKSSDGPYWYESERDMKFLRHFIELRRAGVVGNLLVSGPSGAGKTQGLRRLALSLGIPFYKMDVGSITTEDKWVGQKTIDTTGTHFIMSDHLRWLEAKECEPGMLLYDEINRAHPAKANILIPVLDHSQSIHIPDMGKYIDVNPSTIVVATANIGSGFGGTYTMDRAFRERFNFTLERTWPPLTEEIKVIVSATGCEDDKARLMCEIAADSRVKCETGDIEQPISTRTLVAVGFLVASGMSVAEAFEYTVLPMYRNEGGSASERSLVKLMLTGRSK